jgi:antirestriction protein ArdC
MNKNRNNFDIYQSVTSQIIEILESHQMTNYQKTWFSARGEIFASNPLSKTVYNGLNQLYLSFLINKNQYSQNRWMTFKQGRSAGAKIKKGERSTIVSYYSRKYIDSKTRRNITKKVTEILKNGYPLPDDIEIIPIMKYYPVFNLNQFDWVPEELLFKGEAIEYSVPEKDDLAEEILIKSGANIEYRRFQDTVTTILSNQSANYYIPSKDKIILAGRNQFTGKEAFYKTALHELGHWTGHKSRMNRDLRGANGSKEYALEELTAELFSAFMAARLGFTSQITNNAAYINSWLRCLNEDKKFIFKAAAMAQKACNYVGELVEHGKVLHPAQYMK